MCTEENSSSSEQHFVPQNNDKEKHSSIGTGEKFFICEVCSKGFSNNGNLRAHLLMHTGEKPFVCEICSKGFSQNSCLRAHLLTHTGEKPFVCEICSKGFCNNGNLRRHLLAHTGEKPFVCEICSKGFNDKSALRKHLFIHIGEKPYGCELCSKGFSKNSNLRRHLLTHTGEKPFVCEICSKGFSQNGHLRGPEPKRKKISTSFSRMFRSRKKRVLPRSTVVFWGETPVFSKNRSNNNNSTYWLIPNLPILERRVVTASPDFVKNYQIVTSKVVDDPKVVICPSYTEETDPEPLDLTVGRSAGLNVDRSESECVDLTDELSNGSNPEPEKSNDSNSDSTNSDGSSSFENVDFADHPQVDRSNSEETHFDIEAILNMPFDPKDDIRMDSIISDLYNSSLGMISDLCPSVM